MSSPEKKNVDESEAEKKNVDESQADKKNVDAAEAEAEKEDADDQSSEGGEEDEFPTREIVLGLPALSISQNFGVSSGAEEKNEEEARLMEQAVVAAKLVIAASEEAATKGKNDGGGGSSEKKKNKKKNVNRMRKITDINDEAGGTGEGETKKPRRKASVLTNPPPGPPTCNVCGRGFGSWKAVFGHLRSHKDRNYLGFSPPPTFSAAAERFMIPGPNSAFVLVTAGEGSSGGMSAGGGSATGGEGGRRLDIDLNVDLEDKEEEAEVVAKFDLNKSPPKDEDEAEQGK